MRRDQSAKPCVLKGTATGIKFPPETVAFWALVNLNNVQYT